ncbi:ABC transporter ATP-binding protein [Gordonia rubripertincta]|uniref:ABC transporter ATP-binding protein n=1 Tax=Gordonia rubripertincta TaxID=36822 RepID=A0ABT4MUX3_GORRU|nr:ABC transporter ATP-binding protein [Gordonia rubripertincta]MCZ4550791.1 ABC transporter ATP-binding protein [Gordonia rubripertincta]
MTSRTGPLLILDGIGKSYGNVRALDEVSLTVERGSVHCILGENGAGKSTLCNVVYGTVAADQGRMTIAGETYSPRTPAAALDAGVAMVHQHFSLIPTMTVEDNLLLGRNGFRPPHDAIRRGLDRIADTYGLTVDTKARVRDLPIGARQRVEIVKALLREPSLILLDEPTAVLDPAEIDALIDTCSALAADGKSVVLITHKLGEVSRAADSATVLRSGAVVGGGRLSQTPLSTLLELMLGGAQPIDRGHAPPPRPASDAACLTLEGINLTRADGSIALSEVSLSVRPGEIVGIAGVEGNGQSELAAILAGSIGVDSGAVHLDGADITGLTPAQRTAMGVGVVPEDRHAEGVIPELSIAENMALARLHAYRRWGLLNRRTMNADAMNAISEYSIRADGSDTSVGSLSGGNQQKVVLARELSIPGLRVVVAAQPTRGLDVGAVSFVLERLRETAAAGAAVLVISSEVDELLALCSRIVVAYRGTLQGSVDAGSTTAATTIGELMMGVAA